MINNRHMQEWCERNHCAGVGRGVNRNDESRYARLGRHLCTPGRHLSFFDRGGFIFHRPGHLVQETLVARSDGELVSECFDRLNCSFDGIGRWVAEVGIANQFPGAPPFQPPIEKGGSKSAQSFGNTLAKSVERVGVRLATSEPAGHWGNGEV
jgi:hypothetical protein